MSEQPVNALTLQELPVLRRRTESVSKFLREQITMHLDTLRPLFGPERVFGKNAGGKLEVPDSERALAELQQNYKAFTRKPYDLPEILDLNWLTLVGNSLELYPWEYPHPVEGTPVTITAPLRWAVNYRNNYTLAQVKAVLEGKQTVRPEYLRQFVVNALVLQSLLNRNPRLAELFRDLRFELKTETPAELKGLPIITFNSTISSFRPADNLISAAIAFSGIPAFIELASLDEISNPRDAMKEKLLEMLKS
jgi:hypothetical protein